MKKLLFIGLLLLSLQSFGQSLLGYTKEYCYIHLSNKGTVKQKTTYDSITYYDNGELITNASFYNDNDMCVEYVIIYPLHYLSASIEAFNDSKYKKVSTNKYYSVQENTFWEIEIHDVGILLKNYY